jgi:hypothetical protein
VSFGTGEHFWTNLFPTQLQVKHKNEIKRFKWAIRFMRWTEVFWALIPLKVSLKMFFFSDEYAGIRPLPDRMSLTYRSRS